MPLGTIISHPATVLCARARGLGSEDDNREADSALFRGPLSASGRKPEFGRRADGLAPPMRHRRAVIEIQELTKRYGDTVAVDDLTFSVQPGKVTGFLGPNGAGKSTTLRIALGLGRPTHGRVLLNGRPYRQLREPLRMVGALLDAKAAQRSRTAYHHLLWLARTHRLGRRRVREVLALTGLEPAASRRAGGLSLGTAQRLGIAAALLGDPEILLLDEPANGLDPEGMHWIRTLVRQLAAEGRTVLVSSHLMGEMAITADRLIVIGRGRLLANSSVAEFIEGNRGSSLEEAFLRLTADATEFRASGTLPRGPGHAR